MTPLVAGLALVAGTAQGPPTFSGGRDTVSVDVAVTQRSAPLLGLTAADFELKDDGVRQHVTLANLERLPLTVVLVFDGSSSVAPKLSRLRDAGHALLDGLRPGDEAAIVAFSHRLALVAAPTRDLASAGRALDSIEAVGRTAVYDALYAGLLLPSPARRSVVVLFTDGDDNSSFLSAEQAQAAAERERALVQVVAIRTPEPQPVTGLLGRLPPTAPPARETPGLRALRLAAESTGGRLFQAEGSERLREAFERVLAEMKARYVLQYDPVDVPHPGRHRLEVGVKRHGVDVFARRSYWVLPRSAP